MHSIFFSAIQCITLITIFLSFTGFSHQLQASDTGNARSGIYLGGGIAVVDENFTAFKNLHHDADEAKPGINLKAGYRLSSKFAAETEFRNYAPFDVIIEDKGKGSIKGYSLTLNLKYFFKAERLQPYILAGAGLGHTKNTSAKGREGSDPLGVIGIGIDWYFSPHLLLYFEAASCEPYGSTDEFAFRPVTLGMQYRF